MAERGLLRKAQEIRDGAVAEDAVGWDVVFDESSGISKDDQKDILLHIDRVAQSSRILAGPDTWKVHPRKRGALAPLLVNLGAVVVLAAGLFAIWRVFGSPKTAETVESVSISTAEGRLLQEIRREAEGQIREKDREIAAIQDRLVALDRERARILSSVEDRIKVKEAELDRRLAEEIQKERQRLIAAGLSSATIEERLSAFEKEKAESFRRELAEYREAMEEERSTLHANLDRAQAEYRATLEGLNSERKSILESSRAREQELRAQLDEKNKTLAAERASAAESLKSARQELERMEEESRKVQAAEDRLLGLYSSARQAILEGRVDDASRSAEALRSFLNDPALVALTTLSRRRDSDLFTVDLIERAVAAARAKNAVDVSRVSDALTVMAQIRDESALAEEALKAGDHEGARASYQRMLSALPELDRARAFLESESAGAGTATEQVKAAAVASAQSEMDGAYRARDWAAFDVAFLKLMSALSLDEERSSTVLKGAKESGGASEAAVRKAADTRAAAAPMRTATAALEERRYTDAMQGYASVLVRFPDAEQVPRATEGLRSASRQLIAAFQTYRDETQAKMASLEARIAETQTSPEKTADKGELASETGPESADYAKVKEERDTLRTALADSEARQESLRKAYADFAADEAALLSTGNGAALVAGRSRMDEFFLDDAVAPVLPGMRERIARYLAAYQAAGEKEVLFNAADIVEGASRIRDAAARERFFKDLETRYKDNPTMLEFLGIVRKTLK